MRDRIIPGSLVFTFFAGAVFLWSQQRATTTHGVTTTTVPKLVLSANPVTVLATKSTPVIFSVTATGAVPRLLELFRLGVNGASTWAGTFQEAGNGTYHLELTLGQKTPGTLEFVAKGVMSNAPNITAAASYPAISSNTVQIPVTHRAAPPPNVQILSANLTPNAIVQGARASIAVEATLSTRTPLQVTVRRTDTNETLANLNQPPLGGLTAAIASFASYSGSFTIAAPNAGVVPVQIVAAGGNQPGPAVYNLSLTVMPAPETGTSTNPASRTFPRVGLSLTVPPGWHVNQDIYDSGGPISLDNFGFNYGPSAKGQLCCGGAIPINGATIDVTVRSTANGISAAAYPQTELRGAENIKVDRTPLTRLAGLTGTRAHYDHTYSSGLRFSNIAVYVGQGGLVYKFYLSYRAGDPRTADYTNAFQTLLNSVQFIRGQ